MAPRFFYLIVPKSQNGILLNDYKYLFIYFGKLQLNENCTLIGTVTELKLTELKL